MKITNRVRYYARRVMKTIQEKFPEVMIDPKIHTYGGQGYFLDVFAPEAISEQVDDFAIRLTADLAHEKKVSIYPLVQAVET